MKRTQFLDAIRNIQGRIVSFLSITITVIMGVSGLLCIFFIGSAMNSYASDYYRKYHFKDFDIVSSMGISDDNIQKLIEDPIIRDVEGNFIMDGTMRFKDDTERVSLMSVTQRISIPTIVEGTMPEQPDECALDPEMMALLEITIGDQVTLAPIQQDMDKLLKERTFTVTGKFVHPDYTDKDDNEIVLLPEIAFDKEALSDGYLRAYIEIEMDDRYRKLLDPDYDSIIDSAEDHIRDLSAELSRDRSEEIKAKAWETYDQKKAEADDQLDDGYKKLIDGEQELYTQKHTAETKISGALEDLTGSELKFSDGLRQILQGEQQYQDGITQIENARAKLASVRAQLDQGYAQYQQYAAIGSFFSFLLGGYDPLASARAQLAAGEAQYQQGVAALNQKIADADLPGASAKIDASWEKLKEGRAKLDDSWIAYEENCQEADIKISDGYARLEDGKTEYLDKKSEAMQKLEDGKKEVESIDESRFIVVNRNANAGYLQFFVSIRAINGFGLIFVPMFALVGCLVIYSTIAIIIDEQKRQVGALKAMGFRNGEIRNKYLIFGIGATLIGVLVGIALSLFLERVILNTINNKYNIGALPLRFIPVTAAIVCLGTLITAFFVVWISCRNLLKSTAVGLMNGSEPAKRTLKKSSGRNRSLYSHLIFSNIVTEIPRVLMSMVIIIASVLLIGIGFSMRAAFNGAFDTQEHEIYRYDLLITLNEGADDKEKEKEKKALISLMNEQNISYLPVLYKAASYRTENGSGGFFILCGDSDKLREYYDTSVDLPEHGILLPTKFMETNTFSDTQTMTIYDGKLGPYEAKIAGPYRFYVGYIAVMSPSAYEEIFDEAPEYTSYYCKGTEEQIRSIMSDLHKRIPSAVMKHKSSFAKTYDTTKNLFNMVALIMVLIAGIMTFMIVINLNSILVNRRMKELLIMKVNGFANKDLVGYLLRETILINVVGILIAIGLGVTMNPLLIQEIEPSIVMYIRSVSVFSWVSACVINIVFSVIINAISFRKVGKIPLMDITKY